MNHQLPSHAELGPPPSLAPNTVRIVPLGGLGEIGRNMTVFEYDGQLLIVDCGVLFPEDAQPGVDLILPDFHYIEDRIDDVAAIILTHGHEDHIGALPYVLQQIDAPVYGARLTLGLAEVKLRQRGLLDPDAKPGESPFDHHIWVLASDGDLMEGVSGEASSLAGHQELGNLTVVYDANQISIEDDGTVFVGATDGPSAQAAIDRINAIANPQLPKIGERFLGTVVKITDFGAFVSLLPGRDGLVHISKLGKGKRINKVEDVCTVGDKLRVEIADIDNRGKISLVPVADDAQAAAMGFVVEVCQRLVAPEQRVDLVVARVNTRTLARNGPAWETKGDIHAEGRGNPHGTITRRRCAGGTEQRTAAAACGRSRCHPGRAPRVDHRARHRRREGRS